MAANNFNFGVKFSKWGFWPQILHWWTKSFMQKFADKYFRIKRCSDNSPTVQNLRWTVALTLMHETLLHDVRAFRVIKWVQLLGNTTPLNSGGQKKTSRIWCDLGQRSSFTVNISISTGG